MRIKTLDKLIVPKIRVLLGKPVSTEQHLLDIKIASGELRALLPLLIPHLYTKQPQARYVLEALNIKSGQNTVYTEEESRHWHVCFEKVSALNRRGKRAIIDLEPRDHNFSWPWFAGMIDGDGSILNAYFGQRKCRTLKPILKVSLTHILTIDYLRTQLGVGSLCGGGGKGNKRPVKTIRLMAEKQHEILPQIIPHLVLKREQAELALQIVQLRRTLSSGVRQGPEIDKIKDLLCKLDTLNALSGKSRRKARNQSI